MERAARPGWWGLAGILIGIGIGFGPIAGAQTTKPPAAASTLVAKISAQTQDGQYRIDWNGTSGTFTRKAIGNDPETKLPLAYLQTDPGPNGYAKHLAWFLARDKEQFVLLWCYLDDSGRNFWCCLYFYPTNALLTVPFVGDYQYGPPPAGDRPTFPSPFLTQPPPAYTGGDFIYKDWSRKGGKIDSLTLGNALANGQTLTPDPGKGTKPLTGLRVSPLHEIQVGQGNGWRPGGWQELHALAYDAANDPYYLILYSNTNIGYVVDLKHAQPYSADFGERVQFGGEAAAIGPQGKVAEAEDVPHVVRYTRFEITLNLAHSAAHPYIDVNIDAELHTPNGKVMKVPGFWDGENTFRARIVPTSVGTWSWKILSNNDDLNGKEGHFLCVAEHGAERGFLRITPTRANQRHFVTGGSQPFYPAIATVSLDPEGMRAQNVPVDPEVSLAGLKTGLGSAPIVNFIAFQKRIDSLADMGFNRVYGNFLLSPPETRGLFTTNEGGDVFLNGNPDELNPAFFQALDKRLTYCNAKGIVPDLGISTEVEKLYTQYDDLQLRRFWRYVLGRYACYDICWNLFGYNWWGKAPSTTLDPHISVLANLTHLYDPYPHPLTTLTRFVQTASGAASAPWEDVLSVPMYDTKTVTALYGFNRPIIAVDMPTLAEAALPILPTTATPSAPPPMPPAAETPDSVRYRLWETRMRGGYWASASR